MEQMRAGMQIRSSCLLLDTHAWVWAMDGNHRAIALQGFRGTFAVSVMSVWEIGMLESKGRLQLVPSVEEWVEENLLSPVALQALTPEISLLSTRLEAFHGDPVDRILVATALVTGHPLVTADRKILSWFAGQQEIAHLTVPLET